MGGHTPDTMLSAGGYYHHSHDIKHSRVAVFDADDSEPDCDKEFAHAVP